MKKMGFVLALCSLVLSSNAFGQAKQGGFYLGGAFGQSSSDNAKEFASAFATSGDGSANGVKFYGGYLWGNFGLEVGYHDLGSYSVKTGSVETDKFSVSAVSISGVMDLPMSQSWSLYGKLGLAMTDAKYDCISACGAPFLDTSKSGAVPVIGIGIGWNINKNFTIRADYESFTDVPHGVTSLEVKYPYSFISVGAQVKF